MEYLVVHFTESRRVMVDGLFMGRTEEMLELERGYHDITLETPSNFHPAVHSIVLQDTTLFAPMEVCFEES